MSILAANWKMNMLWSGAKEFLVGLQERRMEIPKHVELFIAPSFLHLVPMQALVKALAFPQLLAQNVHHENAGAHTGSVSLAQLKELGVAGILIGHSECRAELGDNGETRIHSKLQLALSSMRVIYCLGEPLNMREAEKHFDFVGTQLDTELTGLPKTVLQNLILAYEPIWAIGTGKTASPAQAQEMHAFIRRRLGGMFGDAGKKIPILYGGSCKPANAAELFAQDDIDGGLIGGASLQLDSFIEIAQKF